jgi:hypothetical protein
MDNRILVFATPRTGSTYYCEWLAKEHKLDNLQEILSVHPILHNHSHRLEYTPSQKRFFRLNSDLKKKIELLQNQANWVAKIFPHQVRRYINLSYANVHEQDQQIKNFYPTLISKSTKHVFLYRRNFRSQVISQAASSVSGSWYVDRSTRNVKINDQSLLDNYSRLIWEYQQIKEIYQQSPGEIVALEDFGTSAERYPEYKNLTGNFDLVENFDVEQEVFGIKKGGALRPSI